MGGSSTIMLPPQVGERADGGDSGWVELLSAPNEIEAHLVSGRLGEAGIETRCIKDRSAPGAWFFGGSNPNASVAVHVRRIQLAEAKLVLAEIAYEQPPFEPKGSPARGWRGPVLWWVMAVVLGALFTGLSLARAADEVERCGFIVCPVEDR